VKRPWKSIVFFIRYDDDEFLNPWAVLFFPREYKSFDDAVTCEKWHEAYKSTSPPPAGTIKITTKNASPTKECFECEGCGRMYGSYNQALECEATHNISPESKPPKGDSADSDKEQERLVKMEAAFNEFDFDGSGEIDLEVQRTQT